MAAEITVGKGSLSGRARSFVRCPRAVFPSGSSNSGHGVDFKHFVAEVVDDLDRDLARLGWIEGLARRAVQLRPFSLVDFRSQRFLELVVGAFCCAFAAI